eukprot:CAMPEP_0182473734 /NCGR_PEP_ID=MMETSP1319-20130603/24471_1 /TAXON_ID=172717 /ORGANISM="Bolidomonas pacifica, Strain RCC208" /LENGTH=85 /DNA_ID=CAMNT_0024674563 /DNA_START=180 /DNA_END=437 /DNA_ORIENTATION=+
MINAITTAVYFYKIYEQGDSSSVNGTEMVLGLLIVCYKLAKLYIIWQFRTKMVQQGANGPLLGQGDVYEPVPAGVPYAQPVKLDP